MCLKHTLLIRENPLRWFRCRGLFVCWLFRHLFQEHVIAWIWIAQNAVGVFGFAKSLFKSRKEKKTKKKAFPQIQVTKPIDSPSSAENKAHLILCGTNVHPTCFRPTRQKRGAYLLYDILSCAEAGSFDDSAWLLWGDIMYLNKETVILRADGCIFLCFLKDVSLI